MAANARQISDEARELYDRLRIFAEHLRNLGSSLTQTVGHYNKAVGSFEGRLLVQGRKLESLGIPAQPQVAGPSTIEQLPRLLVAAGDEHAALGATTDNDKTSG